tara:strand:+ start:1915 stop:2379 length:465 start_codon:yes stop_codon:yes gene_type:complete
MTSAQIINKKINLSDRIDMEKSDKDLYRKYEKHKLFSLENEKKVVPYHKLFIFFMSIGIIYDKKKPIIKRWNNVTVSGLSEKYVYLIAALSYASNGDENLTRPSAIANEAAEFAKGGLHYLDERIDKDGVDVFLKELTIELKKKCDLLSSHLNL